eukprot:4262079-Alexandrium_andersonii.AAC.1
MALASARHIPEGWATTALVLYWPSPRPTMGRVAQRLRGHFPCAVRILDAGPRVVAMGREPGKVYPE